VPPSDMQATIHLRRECLRALRSSVVLLRNRLARVRKITLAARVACRRVATTDRSLNQANRFNRTVWRFNYRGGNSHGLALHRCGGLSDVPAEGCKFYVARATDRFAPKAARQHQSPTSAYPPKADLTRTSHQVRKVPSDDISQSEATNAVRDFIFLAA
jgi:hypothetical protein